MHDIERYLNIRSAYGASLSPNGALAFLMDTTGVPQVWTLDEPQAWPEQRTFYEESVSFCTFSPARQELVFGMDQGGNERQQLSLLDLDPDSDTTGEITELTGLPGAKHRWGGWSHDGDRFAFASNRRDNAVFDVYVQGREETGTDATRLHEGDGWLTVGGWSPDDSRLLVSEAHSSFDQDLYVLDVASGEMAHLTPHDGDVRFYSASWSPDGDAVYCATDLDSDTLYVGRLPLDEPDGGDEVGAGNEDTGTTVEPVVEGGDWNVDGIAIDDETGRCVYSRNVDGYTELTVGDLDGATVRGPRTLELPGGVAGGVSFDDGARRAAFTVTGRTENTNVHVVDLVDGAGTGGDRERWTDASTAGVPPDSFVEPELVRFETFDGREIPAFLSLPDEARGRHDGDAAGEREGGAEGVPVIVDIHGGPESQRRPSFSAFAQYLLSRGYAVFEPNVRGSTGYGKAYTHLDDVEKRMDSVKDLKFGVEWLADHPAVDADRVVAYGGSYGGFMVLAGMTAYPELWAAGVDVVGIANFVTFLENTGDWRRSLREAEYGSLEDDRAFLEEISPINNIEKIRAPLFVMHGANDPRVPLGEAEQIAEEASEHVPVDKLVFDDEGHGISKLENRLEAYPRIVEFLDQHLD